MKYNICLFFTLALLLVFAPTNVNALAFGENELVLFEDGVRVTGNAIIQDRNYQNPVCVEGICLVGQQYEQVTFYKTKETTVLSYDEWIDNWYLTHDGCEDMVNKKQQITDTHEEWLMTAAYKQAQAKIGGNKEENEAIWNSIEQQYLKFMTETKGLAVMGNPLCKTISFDEYNDVYIKNLKDTAVYSITINNPQDKSQYYCDLGCDSKALLNNYILRLTGSPTYEVDLKTGIVTAVPSQWVMPVVAVAGILCLGILFLIAALLRKQMMPTQKRR